MRVTALGEEFVTKAEHEEFRRTLDERHRRHDKRIELLEEDLKQLNTLTIAVEKLASSMEKMCAEQTKQGERLEALEQKPVKRLDTVTTVCITALVTFAVTTLCTYLLGLL